MKNLIILSILTLFAGCSYESRQNVLDWVSAPVKMLMPSKTHEVAPQSTEIPSIVNDRYDGVLLALAVSGIFLIAINRFKVGLALLASGAGGFILIDLLDAMRVWIHIAAGIAVVGAIGYFIYYLWTSHTRSKSLKFE